MECTCPLIGAREFYLTFGGFQNPCDEKTLVNTAGSTLANFAIDRDAVVMTWEAVADRFYGVNSMTVMGHESSSTARVSLLPLPL